MRTVANRARAGFTLLELMIVVSIVGILAATAMPAFQGYLMKSRANEGRMLVEIMKLRQEAYRSEFGQYVTTSANPTGLNGTTYMPWNGGDPNWIALGFNPPSNRSRFTLTNTAYLPGVVAWGMTGNDFSYMSQATGDLDSDGQLLIFQGYSEADYITCNREKEWE